MRGPLTARGLVVRVILLAAVLVGLSRWAGRVAGTAGGPAAEPPPGETPGGTAPAEAGMDLSFYKALGGGRAQTPREPALSPAPRDEAAAAPAGAYVVQALATRDGAAARRLRSRLAARGLPATLLESRDAQGPIFRVRVGRYRDRAGAEAVARRARAIPGLDPWVLRESE